MSDRNEIVSRVTAALEASRLRWRFATRARWMRAANGADIGSSPMPLASSWRPARGRSLRALLPHGGLDPADRNAVIDAEAVF